MEPPEVILRPTTRLAYWTGIRRWPSWTKTMATITARAMNGIITTKTWSGLLHHCVIPFGSPETIEAKIISEMPLPMPRWVISSPSHISKVAPAVRQMTIRKTLVKVSSPTTLVPAWLPKERKRKT